MLGIDGVEVLLFPALLIALLSLSSFWVFAGGRGGLVPSLKTGIAVLDAVIILTSLTESLGTVLFISAASH